MGKEEKIEDRIDPQSIDERFILNFRLNSFEQKVIKLIYEMRLLSTSQIVDITNLNRKYVREHLLRLYKNGFLYRRYKSLNVGENTKEVYWMLDRGGALFLAGAYGMSIKTLNWSLRDNLIAFEKLEHSLKISDVRTTLELAARERNHKIENCLCDRHLYFEFKYEDRKGILRPDLFFTYNDGEKLYQYFFEIDMGTMAINGPKTRTSNIVSKVPKYEGYLISKAWEENFEVFPRVIFLTTHKKRAIYMMDAVKENQQTKLEFLFSTFDFFKLDPLGSIYKKNGEEITSLFK